MVNGKYLVVRPLSVEPSAAALGANVLALKVRIAPNVLESDTLIGVDLYRVTDSDRLGTHMASWRFLGSVGLSELEIELRDCATEVKIRSRHEIRLVRKWADASLRKEGSIEARISLRRAHDDEPVADRRVRLFDRSNFEQIQQYEKAQTLRYLDCAKPRFQFPHGVTIRLVCRNVFEGDAVGNFALGIARWLRVIEIPVQLYAHEYGAREALWVRDVEYLTVDLEPQDVIFYNHSIFDASLDVIAEMPQRKVAYLHGVTPPHLLLECEPETAWHCEQGIAQYRLLANFDVLSFNSVSTRDDWRKAIAIPNIEHSIRQYIFPPIIGRLKQFASEAERPKRGWDQPAMLYVGRLASHKRVEDLICLFDKVAARVPTAELWLVGSSGHPRYMEKVARHIALLREEVSRRVRFFGHISDEELAELYKRAALFVSMSRHEGFGIPVVESMSAGLPVVVFANSATVELTKEKEWTFLDRGIPELADVVVKLFSDTRYYERASEFSRRTASRLMESSSGAPILSLLNQLLNNRVCADQGD